jgi:hypothetical protein
MKHVVCCLAMFIAATANAEVHLVKTPNKGIQPQAVVDAKGVVHLLYFTGDPKHGNLEYVRREAGKKEFSKPIQVNSQDGSAIAIGTIRGGHIALGKDGRIHVAWNGSSKAEPKNPIEGVPMLYARLNDKGTEFEKQRNLMTKSAVLDGGGSLTADAKGNVFVAWHGLDAKGEKGEQNRKVWVAISNDDGKTFAAEKPAWDKKTGACGCCGMRGFTDSKGNVYFVYRAASEKVNRGMYVLMSKDQGKSFSGEQLDNWKVDTCPMSSEAFAEGPDGICVVWDNDGGIFLNNRLFSKAQSLHSVPKGSKTQQHPALAFNKRGDMIRVWTEGTGWNRGGDLVWEVVGKNREADVRRDAIPVWGLPAVIAEPNGDFTIFH